MLPPENHRVKCMSMGFFMKVRFNLDSNLEQTKLIACSKLSIVRKRVFRYCSALEAVYNTNMLLESGMFCTQDQVLCNKGLFC